MSWDSYLDQLKGRDHSGSCPIEEAAIWGQTPLSVWACTDGLKSITAQELQGLIGDRTCLQQGMTIAGKRCVFLKDDLDTDDVHMLNLKTRKEGEEASCCISIGKTKTAYVITKGCATAQGGQVPSKTYNIVDYLRKAGY